jgi:hypothetical protein
LPLGNAFVTDLEHPESIADRTVTLPSLHGKFDTDAYLSPYSDVVALEVFGHQMRMMNLFTRVGWEFRVAEYEAHRDGTASKVGDAVNELVDYMLFIDEAPLGGKIVGTSGFQELFASRGPRDRMGRSLRDFDLESHFMKYPCSYMIYSPAFDGLPQEAKDAIYKRMWQILSGEERAPRYTQLTSVDRRAVVEILRETRSGLPKSFK